MGADYMGPDSELALLTAQHAPLHAALGIGQVSTGKKRHELYVKSASVDWKFPALVSPQSIVNESTVIGEASAVMDGVIINSGTSIGKGVILNTGCTVEHDATIADWVHLAPGCIISGGTKVGRFCMIGAGSVVIEGINIAEDCIIGAGATVVNDITEPGIYAGCPARRIK